MSVSSPLPIRVAEFGAGLGSMRTAIRLAAVAFGPSSKPYALDTVLCVEDDELMRGTYERAFAAELQTRARGGKAATGGEARKLSSVRPMDIARAKANVWVIDGLSRAFGPKSSPAKVRLSAKSCSDMRVTLGLLSKQAAADRPRHVLIRAPVSFAESLVRKEVLA